LKISKMWCQILPSLMKTGSVANANFLLLIIQEPHKVITSNLI